MTFLKKVCRTALLTAACCALALPALAQQGSGSSEPTSTRPTIPPGTKIPEAARNRAPPQARAADGSALAVPKAAASKSEAKLVRYLDGAVLIGVTVAPDYAAMLVKAGFRRVSSAKDITDRTIFKNVMYQQFDVANNGPTASQLERLVGKTVEVTFAREASRRAVVATMKRK